MSRQRTADGAIERARQEHVGRLLLRSHRLFVERALSKLNRRGHPDLGMAHVGLLPHIEAGGTPASLLAERAGITKQAAGKLVADLEASGYVERVDDETDARVTRILFTRTGRRFLLDAQKVKQEIEAEFATAIGKHGLKQLRELLTRLLSSVSAREGST